MILKVENVAKAFGKKQVLTNVSFSMESGQLYGIVGENGSGKSTLLKIIVGEWKPDKGHATIDGGLGYCPQKCELIPQLTIDEHFKYFASAFGMTDSQCQKESESLMDYFNFKKYRSDRVHKLSGGTQQKLNLSIALMHKPLLLVLDEPYSGFDWDTYQRFWTYTSKLIKEGCAVLVVTHLLTDREHFDHIYQLDKGQLA